MVDPNGWTPICMVISQQRIEIVQVLIENEANPNLLNGIGRSLLSEAIIIHSLEIATFLVENGAKMNVLVADGYSQIYKAVKSDNTKILKHLIRNGAELKAQNIDGYDSFEVAFSTKKQNAAKMLQSCHRLVFAANSVSPV